MEVNELLLNSWIKMDVSIRGNRLVDKMSLNEMIICGQIYNDPNTSASKLCSYLHMLKSQVNKILTQLEEKGIVTKKISETDKRKSYLSLSDYGKEFYLQEHNKVLDIVDKIVNEMGQEKASILTKYMLEAISIIEREENL